MQEKKDLTFWCTCVATNGHLWGKSSPKAQNIKKIVKLPMYNVYSSYLYQIGFHQALCNDTFLISRQVHADQIRFRS